MPLVEHPRNGLYFDECAPHMRVRVVYVVALLAAMVLWLALIFLAVAVYRFLRGGV